MIVKIRASFIYFYLCNNKKKSFHHAYGLHHLSISNKSLYDIMILDDKLISLPQQLIGTIIQHPVGWTMRVN